MVLTLQEEEHEDHQDEKVVEYGIVTDNDDGTYSISSRAPLLERTRAIFPSATMNTSQTHLMQT